MEVLRVRNCYHVSEQAMPINKDNLLTKLWTLVLFYTYQPKLYLLHLTL